MPLGNLQAPLDVAFDYTRSVGPTIGVFLTGLREHRVYGARTADGRVLVPPPEFDPHTHAPMLDFVEVATTGTVTSWSWNPAPALGQPLTTPFAWALVTLDGADSAILHAVDVATPADIHTGMRVQIRWAPETTGSIHDIAAFVAALPQQSREYPPEFVAPAEPVARVITPVRLGYQHSASAEESFYLRGLAEGKVLGGRTRAGAPVYVPPRSCDPATGEPVTEQVEVSDRGTVTTFCIVNVPFLGQRIKPPYIAAYVLLDGADVPFLHLVLECDAAEVRMGMRVEAVWKLREQWGFSLENIDHFRPSGEPDADYESYAKHL